MPDIISTDHPLSASQRFLLAALLDTLVPASDDGAMPSAADVGFDRYLVTQAADFVPALTVVLDHFAPSFGEASTTERCAHVTLFGAQNPPLFQALLNRVYDCYYQSDRVRTQIGVATGAPFPQGNQLAPGDLSLLDPVIANAAQHTYRKV